jgi:nitrite reductase/ring-hydroxylating ferredoxin subunit
MADWVKVASVDEIKPGKMKKVEVNGVEICLANVGGKFFAIGNVCTHTGGPLCDGSLEGFEVECPWHGSKFDVRSGKVTNPPAREPEPAFEVKVQGKDVLVKA